MRMKGKQVGTASEDFSFSLDSEVYVIEDVVEYEDAYRLVCRVGDRKRIVVIPKIGGEK